jgi:hypothetical protein
VKRPWLKTTLLGTAFCALLGSGLWAVVVDAGSARDNTIESGDFHGVHYLEVAEENKLDPGCHNVSWQSDIGPQVIGDINLDNGDVTPDGSEQVGDFLWFCARTVQTGTYKLKVGLRSIVDSETDCSTTSSRHEMDNDPDSCGTGLGELSKVLSVSFGTGAQTGAQGDCQPDPDPNPANQVVPTPHSFTSLDLDHGGSSVDVCTVTIAKSGIFLYPKILIDEAATAELRNAAQSDKVQFNLYFTVEPVEEPAP